MIPIGEVARRAGVAASGWSGGRRIYGEEILDRPALIGVAKAAGFRLSEIRARTTR